MSVVIGQIKKTASSAVLSEVKESVKEAVNDVEQNLDEIVSDPCTFLFANKFVFLALKKITDAEWELLDKHGLRPYEYKPDTAKGRGINDLLSQYDVVIVDINGDVGRTYWQQHLYSFPRKDVCVVCVCNTGQLESFVTTYKIQSQIKAFPDFMGDEDSFCRALIGGSLPKPVSWLKKVFRRVVRFLVGS